MSINGTVKISLDDYKMLEEHSKCLSDFNQTVKKIIKVHRNFGFNLYGKETLNQTIFRNEINKVAVVELVLKTFFENHDIININPEIQEEN